MPLVAIHMRKGRSPELKKQMLDAVHESLVASFKIPDHDRKQRILEYEALEFETGPVHSADFTLVEISAFPGRSLEAKRALYAGIVQRFEALGIPGSDIFIVLNEPPLENWGIRGGKPACEVAMGYEIKV